MKFINRIVVVLKPKQGYLDWMASLPDPSPVLIPSLEEARTRECTSFLVPEYDTIEQVQDFIFKNSKAIIEYMCEAWDTREEVWPRTRNRSMLKSWFDLEVHSELIDLAGGHIEVEEL